MTTDRHKSMYILKENWWFHSLLKLYLRLGRLGHRHFFQNYFKARKYLCLKIIEIFLFGGKFSWVKNFNDFSCFTVICWVMANTNVLNLLLWKMCPKHQKSSNCNNLSPIKLRTLVHLHYWRVSFTTIIYFSCIYSKYENYPVSKYFSHQKTPCLQDDKSILVTFFKLGPKFYFLNMTDTADY